MQQKIQSAITDFLSDNEHAVSLSGTGPVYRLENKFSSLVGFPFSLAVNNATLGLWAVFHSLGIHDADVVTTPFTWGGSLAGLLLTGNRPVFADIDPETLTLDPGEIIKCLTPRTKAILAVDIYGYPCDGKALRKIADEYGLALIQDCAQSFGSYREAQHTGFWADAAVFSFTWGKALSAGEGGMIVTPHEKLFRRLVEETQHPLRQRRDVPYQAPNEIGLNLRIHPLAAVWAEAVFDDALVRIEEHRSRCVQILQRLYNHRLSKTKVPNLSVQPSFHALTVEPRESVATLERFLHENSLSFQLSPLSIVEPLYRHPRYKQLSYTHGWGNFHQCPVAERQCRQRIRLVRNESCTL